MGSFIVEMGVRFIIVAGVSFTVNKFFGAGTRRA